MTEKPKTAAEAKALVNELGEQYRRAQEWHRELMLAECPFTIGDYVKGPKTYGGDKSIAVRKVVRLGISFGRPEVYGVERVKNGAWGRREVGMRPNEIVKVTPQEAGEPS